MITPQTGYTCTHAVTSIQLQNTPCTAQIAGHRCMQTWPAKLRAPSATILAAVIYPYLGESLITPTLES